MYTAGARAHTDATGTRRGPEGRPDRTRGTHRPHGMAYQQAKERDIRTEARGTGKQKGGGGTGTAPPPPPLDLPRAPRTHKQGTAPAKAVVAHGATHQSCG